MEDQAITLSDGRKIIFRFSKLTENTKAEESMMRYFVAHPEVLEKHYVGSLYPKLEVCPTCGQIIW